VAGRTRSRVIEAVADVLAGEHPDAAFGVYDGPEWAVTPAYFAARGKWPTGPCRIAPLPRITATTACAVGICHPRLPSARIGACLAGAGIRPEHATMSYGAPEVLDVAPPGVDKGSGVLRLLARHGIPAGQAMGFGDAPGTGRVRPGRLS
jgi:hydroxymethylpyrimidine pyrophosphatase-like HAD family hydrolase